MLFIKLCSKVVFFKNVVFYLLIICKVFVVVFYSHEALVFAADASKLFFLDKVSCTTSMKIVSM